MASDVRDSAALADELLQRLGRTVGDRAVGLHGLRRARRTGRRHRHPGRKGPLRLRRWRRPRRGSGSGDEQGSGAGGGGGAAVRPVGYLELKDGETRFRRITSPTDALVLSIAVSLAALTVRKLLR